CRISRSISSMLQGLARSMSLGKERKVEEEHQGTVLRSSGTLWGEGSETFAAACWTYKHEHHRWPFPPY
uniref:Uncharacterized protein n=1 Tax=Aegilops tauschii subsp. strangulata TaxID=200361 RepID=A0A453JYZ5_AEGTS